MFKFKYYIVEDLDISHPVQNVHCPLYCTCSEDPE